MMKISCVCILLVLALTASAVPLNRLSRASDAREGAHVGACPTWDEAIASMKGHVKNIASAEESMLPAGALWEAFNAFAKREHNAENNQFLEAVELKNQVCETNHNSCVLNGDTWLNDIFTKFIDKNADEQINLDNGEQIATTEDIATVVRHATELASADQGTYVKWIRQVCSHAATSIKNLIKDDTWKRFSAKMKEEHTHGCPKPTLI